MKLSLRAASIGVALLIGPLGCSGGHGFLGGNYRPTGRIVVLDSATGVGISSSLASPFVDSASAFSIGIEETNYDGPYTITITAWNTGTNEPCFGFTTPGTTQTTTTNPAKHINTVTFTEINTAATGTGVVNPCVTNGSDEETALISDGKGNSVNFFYVLD
jgi:hypothetical protein